jgi:hypothetical protein
LGAYISSARTLIAATLYVQTQIKKSNSHSKLSDLINSKLGISANNELDEEDKKACFFSAKEFIESTNAFNNANNALKNAGRARFTIDEWSTFKTYLQIKSAQDPSPNYPITVISQKLFGEAFALTGVTAALIGTGVIRKSTNTLSAKIKLTALLGSTLLVFNIIGPSAVTYAPLIAEGVIGAVSYISLASFVGPGMRKVGQGVGFVIGRPLDLSCQLFYATCKAVHSHYYSSEINLITGHRIIDGVEVFKGMVLEALPSDQLPSDCKIINVNIEDGKIYIDDKLIEVSETEVILPQEIIDQLSREGKEIPLNDSSSNTQLELTENHFSV